METPSPSPAGRAPLLLEPVDLLLLSATAPLSDAVSATVCARWGEAADLWLDVCRQDVYLPMAARCGLEATLQAGLYDLAQYFHTRLDDTSSLPDFLAEPWRQSLPIRRDRARHHAERRDAPLRPGSLQVTRRLVDLRFYREAIGDIFRRRLIGTDRRAAVSLLAECYVRLGRHEALVALGRSHPFYLPGAGLKDRVLTAERALAREAVGPVQCALEFARRHPAGHLLVPFLQSPQLVFAPHG